MRIYLFPFIFLFERKKVTHMLTRPNFPPPPPANYGKGRTGHWGWGRAGRLVLTHCGMVAGGLRSYGWEVRSENSDTPGGEWRARCTWPPTFHII